MKIIYRHLDYRNAKIIHLVNNGEERFIYQNQDIPKEVAVEMVLRFKERKQEMKLKNTKQ